MPEWDKADIIHFLSDLHGYQSYLELCTPTTGAVEAFRRGELERVRTGTR